MFQRNPALNATLRCMRPDAKRSATEDIGIMRRPTQIQIITSSQFSLRRSGLSEGPDQRIIPPKTTFIRPVG